MSRRQLQEIIRNLQDFYKCPSCAVSYYFDDIKVLGQIDPYCFVQLTCHNCSMPVLATVAIGAVANQQTDLSKSERTKFARLSSITSEEVAGFYKFISSYKGSLKEKL